MKIEDQKSRLKLEFNHFVEQIIYNLGYYDGIRVFPRSVTHRKSAMFLHSNQFCLIWKSEKVSFNQAFKELKENIKVVDKYITEEKLILILNMNSYQKN